MTAYFAGDHHGLSLPRTPEDLRAAGPAFLTRAFQAAGTLRAANRIARVTELTEVSSGDTGRTAFLSVEYADPAPHLHTDLVVTFTHDPTDPVRDTGWTKTEREVRLAELSRQPAFPIAVPETLFADQHGESGTGILITERITFGSNGIEPRYRRCRDYEIPDQLGHYRVLITALAQLAGTDRAGRFAPELIGRFPTDTPGPAVGHCVVDPQNLQHELVRLVDFVAAQPGLFRPFVRAEPFLDTLPAAAAAVAARAAEVWQLLEGDTDYLALCHPNAGVHNAWFFRDLMNELQCGLLNWGGVGRMHVTVALWGALSGAEATLWDRHVDELLELFATEYTAAGGPELDATHLRTRLFQYVGVTGVGRLLDVPALLGAKLGASLTGLTRADARIADDETLRVPLQMLTNVLDLWQRYDIAGMFGTG